MRPESQFVTALVAVTVINLWAPAASAQSRGDPADPAVQIPAAVYRSPFADYRPIGEEAIGNWRATNDEVGRIGGWREYAREAQATTSPQPASGAAAPKPGPDTHKGAHDAHKQPGGQR